MKELHLTNGGQTFIDDDLYFNVINCNWRRNTAGYVICKLRGRTVYLHRYVLRAKLEQEVDHINRDKLDNRRENLRFCTHSQNLMNRKKRSGCVSKYKGVYYDKGNERWRAEIYYNNKRIRIGRFKNEADAAMAYNEAARKYHREFASLNKI